MNLTLEDLGLEREDVLKEVEEKRRNREYIDTHQRELRESYPDAYVGVFNAQVVATSETLDGVLKVLRQKLKDGLGAAQIEFITAEDVVWIL